MAHLPKLFFATAAIFALAGMIWGIQMSASHDHTLSPAHGHLNLMGFVAMSVFGAYYALTPTAAASPVASVHYGVTVASVLVLVPGIVMAINGDGEILAQIGSLLAVVSMALFAGIVLWKGVGETAAPRAGRLPAE